MNGIGGNILQKWARRLGLGRPTGIDLPGGVGGAHPQPRLARPPLPQEAHIDQPWTVGDNVNLAVGQGDLQATPLQLATAYSTSSTTARCSRRT